MCLVSCNLRITIRHPAFSIRTPVPSPEPVIQPPPPGENFTALHELITTAQDPILCVCVCALALACVRTRTVLNVCVCMCEMPLLIYNLRRTVAFKTLCNFQLLWDFYYAHCAHGCSVSTSTPESAR